jgi:hypothetical protein
MGFTSAALAGIYFGLGSIQSKDKETKNHL